MTDQELFDKVAAHLRAQNAKALSDAGGCMYRAPGGKRCAAGCLILDKHYSHDIEGRSVGTPEVRECLQASGVNGSQIELVHTLQQVHDCWPVYQWPSELARVAEQYRLTPPAAP